MSHVPNRLAAGDTLLEVRDLRTHFDTLSGPARSVDGVSYTVRAGQTLGVVGESGCGKSVTALSIMRLLATPPARISGQVRLRGTDLLTLGEKEMRAIRGNRISMIFQEPMTSLNPVLTVGRQIAETVRLHQRAGRAEAMARAVEMLKLVQIPEPARRAHEYPHQLSGGMRQRVMIALAFSCDPQLLIADEPTTALDVTVQRQVLLLLREKARQRGTAILLITHDMAVVSQFCDRVYVMYTGAVVEQGSTAQVMLDPQHPYTRGLLSGLPEQVRPGEPLLTIPGQVPNLAHLPGGCTFRERCSQAMAVCAQRPPLHSINASQQHKSACWLAAPESAQ